MASANSPRATLFGTLGHVATAVLVALGDFALFSLQTVLWMIRRRPRTRTLLPVCYMVGVQSVPVVAVTGMFIGMVMAVQFYNQFYMIGLQTRLGSLINISIVRELGPVLAATMLAGRVGSAMAAELATMRITEQVDAISALGTHPLAYLVVPRLIASVLLIPLLTILADFMGIMGGAFICTRFYGVESHYYWEHTQEFIGLWDVFTGLFKAIAFGTLIGLISCHRGLNSKPGAQGVGLAATEAFVISFICILIMDFFLGMFLISLYNMWWGDTVQSFV
jgi:phospholipid/cholesterol/gamma-HCH transport system permease protein